MGCFETRAEAIARLAAVGTTYLEESFYTLGREQDYLHAAKAEANAPQRKALQRPSSSRS